MGLLWYCVILAVFIILNIAVGKKGGKVEFIGGIWLIFGAPACLAIEFLLDGEGGVVLLIIVIVGAVLLKLLSSPGFEPPPEPKPPAYVEKTWQHSPGGIETQIFEGGYHGELNKEFESK